MPSPKKSKSRRAPSPRKQRVKKAVARPVRIKKSPAVEVRHPIPVQSPPVPIPPILLEGDELTTAAVSAAKPPGRTGLSALLLTELDAALAVAEPAEVVPPPESVASPAVLTESEPALDAPGTIVAPQGTPESLWDLGAGSEADVPHATVPKGTLSLTVRDPHSLVADWNLPEDEAERVRISSADRHLVLRVFEAGADRRLLALMHLPGDRRTQLVEFASAGITCVAELGVFDVAGTWVPVAESAVVTTPEDRPSAERVEADVGPVRPEASFQEMVGMVESAALEHVALSEAIHQLRAVPPGPGSGSERELDFDRALAELVAAEAAAGGDLVQALHEELHVPGGRELSSGAWAGGGPGAGLSAGPGEPGAEGIAAVSSHEVPEPPGVPRDFWFNLNADLVLYGGTESDARVVIAGKPVALRPDGTFTLRFTLPDGDFELEARAVSVGGEDVREARLQFRRRTEYRAGTMAAAPEAGLEAPPKV